MWRFGEPCGFVFGQRLFVREFFGSLGSYGVSVDSRHASNLQMGSASQAPKENKNKSEANFGRNDEEVIVRGVHMVHLTMSRDTNSKAVFP